MKTEIVEYKLSHDRKGLVAVLNTGDKYHVHSDEMSKLEVWIYSLLLNMITFVRSTEGFWK